MAVVANVAPNDVVFAAGPQWPALHEHVDTAVAPAGEVAEDGLTGSQSRQTDLPVPGLNVPAPQAEQMCEAAPDVPRNFPAKQAVHDIF